MPNTMPPYAQRRENLRSKLVGYEADGILVTNLVNLTYLTGFTTSSAQLIITPQTEIVITDSRYTEQLQTQCPDLAAVIRERTITIPQAIATWVQQNSLKSLAVEDSMSVGDYDRLKTELTYEPIKTSSVVNALRQTKDEGEIASIRHSIAINEQTFLEVRSNLTPDWTERQMAHELEHTMRAKGAQCCSFDPIVGVGPRAALPHGRPTEQRLGTSPFVLVDWGANVDHYVSDITRMIIHGPVEDQFREIYETVLAAELAGIAAIRPGAELKEIHLTAARIIDDAGYGDYFGHALGHGIGLEVHEAPNLSIRSTGKLAPGMVVTVEPGIYLPGFAGVRIEDDVLVTENGAEVLSKLPKLLDECTVDLCSG